MSYANLLPNVAALAARVPDGSMVAIGKTDTGPAMELTRALVRRGVRHLHLLCVPTSGLQADLLIGAGCVAIVETAGITFGELGHAPAFGRAVREGLIELRDSTCPAIYAGLQASEKGIPSCRSAASSGPTSPRGAAISSSSKTLSPMLTLFWRFAASSQTLRSSMPRSPTGTAMSGSGDIAASC
ncbi:MAG: CoA transferase [Pseudomonadota bacterium]